MTGLRHCSAPGTVAARVAAGPSQSGALASRSSPKWPTASFVVGDHHEAQPAASLGVQRLELAEVVEPADQAAVDVRPVVVQHLLLPLAHVGGADPQRPVDPGVHQALVRLAAMLALGAAPVSHQWNVGAALDAGATVEEILGTMIAVAPISGITRVVQATPDVALPIGYDLDAAFEELDPGSPRA